MAYKMLLEEKLSQAMQKTTKHWYKSSYFNLSYKKVAEKRITSVTYKKKF